MQNHNTKNEMKTDSDRNMNSLHGYNNMVKQAVSTNDRQNNFYNQNLFYQNGVGGNVIQQQQQIDFNNMPSEREMRPSFNRNTESFQTIMMSDSPNYMP